MANSAVADTAEATGPATPRSALMPTRDRLIGFAKRAYWLWPALLMLACGGYGLGTPSLWDDELATWGAVRLGWGALFRLLGNVDAVVAPYYVVAKVWTGIAGTSPVALRAPSLVAMAVAAGLLTVLGTRLRGRRVGLLAGVTFALVPSSSRYAQEARPYAFAILFAVLCTLLLVRYLDRPGTATGLGYAVCVALLGAAHVIALLLLLAHAVVARQRLARWAAWIGLGVLPVLPLLWLGYRQSGQVSWIPPAHLHIVLSSPDLVFGSPDVAGALIALSLLAFSIRRGPLLLASWALVPLAALALIGQFAPLFYGRYLLYTLPAWAVLAALALRRLSTARALAVVLVVALLGTPTQNAIRDSDGHGTASREAGRIIGGNERPGDGVAYKLDETAPWATRDILARYVPADRQPRDIFATSPQRTGGRLAAAECADLAACLDRADPARLWVVRRRTQTDPLLAIGQPKEDLLRARYHLVRLWLISGLTIALYARN
jgi:mannosyltransferase